MVYGKYELLLPESEALFVYTRTMEDEKLLVVCSFCDHETDFTVPDEFLGTPCLIFNTNHSYDGKEIRLGAYEAFVLRKG